MSVQNEQRDDKFKRRDTETRQLTNEVTECKDGAEDSRTMLESETEAKGPPVVPLRLRQLPASFWQEPNRPKYQLHPLQFSFTTHFGQEYNKSVLPGYKDFNVFSDVNYNSSILGHDSGMASRPYSVAQYLYHNYAAKYQSNPTKVPEFSWTYGLSNIDSGNKIAQRTLPGLPSSRTLPGLSSSLFPSASSSLVSSPSSSSSSQNSLCINNSYPCPVTCSGLHPGHWEGVALGQYPSHTLPPGLAPWRPVPTKSSSYSTRFHPFAV